MVLGKLGPGQSGPGQLGPGQLGPGQLGPGALILSQKEKDGHSLMEDINPLNWRVELF